MLALSLALMMAATTLFSGYGRDVLQPHDLSSPSGEWTARTDPSSKFGDGPSRIQVSHGGTLAWEAEVPFTFWEAQLSDGGQLAGYGFTEGHQDRGARGDLVLAIFAPDGRQLLDEHHVLEWSRFIHCPPNPRSMGQFVQPALDRFVLRVADEDVNRRDESWWVYRLSTGESLGRIQPKHEIGAGEDTRSSMTARPIAGTPLTLVQWYVYVWDEHEGSLTGTRFTLLGEHWKPVWTLELARDYVHADDAEAERLRDEGWEGGGILVADEPGRFELRHVAAQQRVSYAVEADPASESGWTVRELARAPYVAAIAKVAEFPQLELAKIATVPLNTAARPAGGPVHDVLAFDFDDAGAVRVVRGEAPGGQTLLTLDPGGAVLREARVDELLPGVEGARSWHWMGAERWLFMHAPFGENLVSRGWFVDAATGAATEIEGFAGPAMASVCRLPGGGFVLLGSIFRPHTIHTALIAFDASGQRRWEHVEAGDDGSDSNIIGADGLAVEADGSVLLLNSDQHVQVFGTDGRFVRAVTLDGLAEDAYLAGLRIEPAGTWLVFEFSSDGSQWHRFDRAGRKLASFAPRNVDGTPNAQHGGARIDPTGGFWNSDGQALSRLDESGVLRPRLGSGPDSAFLETPLLIGFDDDGRLVVVDKRSRSIHLFNASGERDHVLQPEPADLDESWHSRDQFVSAPDGRLFVPGHGHGKDERDRYLEFAPDGARVGWTGLGGDRVAFRADGGRWAAQGFLFGVCSVTGLGATGQSDVSFSRRPNGDFHLEIDAIDCGSDGSLAVLSGADDGRLELDLYSRTGEVLRTVDLHAAGARHWNRLSQNERWILVSSFHTEALLVPRDGSAPRRVQVDEGSRNGGCAFTLSPDGAELWCATREPLALHRYALPEPR